MLVLVNVNLKVEAEDRNAAAKAVFDHLRQRSDFDEIRTESGQAKRYFGVDTDWSR